MTGAACAECGASGVVCESSDRAPAGALALCPGRMDGSELGRVFCEACAGSGALTVRAGPSPFDCRDWGVWVGGVLIGTGQPATSRLLATKLRADPKNARRVRDLAARRVTP